MNLTRRLAPVFAIVVFAFATPLLVPPTHAQQSPLKVPADPHPLWVIDFIDLTPPNAEAGDELVEQYVRDTRKDPGIVRCDGMSQSSRPNHLMVVEVWQDQAAFDKHEAAAHTKEFRTKLGPMLGAPFDQRLHFVIQ